MGWAVKHFSLRGSLEGILEGIGYIRNTNGEVVCGSNGNNQPECGCYYDWREGLVKVNTFYLGSAIGTMDRALVVDIVADILD